MGVFDTLCIAVYSWATTRMEVFRLAVEYGEKAVHAYLETLGEEE